MKNEMKILIMIIALFFTFANIIYAQEKNMCISCHTDEEMLPEDYSEHDIHLTSGISCNDCHGGNPNSEDADLSMSKSAGFIGVPTRSQMSSFCGKCHSNIDYMKKYRPRIETDQVEQYSTSQHGLALKKGDKNVAVCISCHTAHNILPATDPRSTTYAINIPNTCNQCHGNDEIMKVYNIDSHVYDDFAKGVHGIALLKNKDTGAPSCNDCHGNHGATPPGINSISNVCGMCHVSNVNYFKQSAMFDAFTEMEFHGCEECHSNHFIKKPNDKMLGTGEESNCMICHSEGDKGYTEAEQIYSHINNLSILYDSANVKLAEVRDKGMNDIDIEFILKESHQALIQSRTLIHTFDSKQVGEKTEEGVKAAQLALSKSNNEISDYFDRRNGFGVATFLITILIIALYLKSRELNRDVNK
jgi:hypothetical protein